MTLFPVALALFHRSSEPGVLEVWTQKREDDGPFHGLQEFPGGGVEAHEQPLEACVREVEEEVGIKIESAQGRLMGVYPRETAKRTILLYVFLFPDQVALAGKGRWLRIEKEKLSSVYEGIIPFPNHQIIDDLYSGKDFVQA